MKQTCTAQLEGDVSALASQVGGGSKEPGRVLCVDADHAIRRKTGSR